MLNEDEPAVKWNKMAYQTMFLLLCLLALSVTFSSEAFKSYPGRMHVRRSRSHRGTQKIKYDLEKTQPTAIPENANAHTVLFDLKSVNFDGEPAASFKFQVITTEDSVPDRANLFTVDQFNRLKFSNLSNPKEFFDYEQYKTIVVIVQATSMTGRSGKKKI